MHPPYTLTLPNHPHPLHIRSFTLTEALNQAPQLVVEAESDNAWEPCVGHTALFSLHAASSDAIRAQIVEALGGSPPYPAPLQFWHSTVYSCQQLRTSADLTHCRLTLSSRFAVLKRHFTSRLFQNQSVPDIVAALLRKHGYLGDDFHFQLSRHYPLREYTTQYQESDWDFIARLCAQEGIFFYFSQEQNKDVWKFAD